MSTPRLLPAPEPRESERFAERHWMGRVAELEKSNEELRSKIIDLESSLKIATHILSSLRNYLHPFHNLLNKVFGELNEADLSKSPVVGALESNFWETQKRRFPGKQADIIDLLLERPMTVMQIVTAGRMDRKTIYNHIGKLTKAGLVTNSGGVFSLTRQ